MARSRESKIELTAYDDLFETDESRAEANLSKIREIPIAEIDEFPDHPFKVLMDEDMEQLVDSVRRRIVVAHCFKQGVLLFLGQIGDFHRRAESNLAFIDHLQDFGYKLGQTDIALDLITAFPDLFSKFRITP